MLSAKTVKLAAFSSRPLWIDVSVPHLLPHAADLEVLGAHGYPKVVCHAPLTLLHCIFQRKTGDQFPTHKQSQVAGSAKLLRRLPSLCPSQPVFSGTSHGNAGRSLEEFQHILEQDGDRIQDQANLRSFQISC